MASNIVPKNRSKSAAAAKPLIGRTTKNRDVAFADKLFKNFEAQAPQLTSAERDGLEAAFLNLDNRRIRRIALESLAMSGSELLRVVTADRDGAIAFASVENPILEYAQKLHEFAEIMSSASVRIGVALCNRPDMASVKAAAKAAANG